MTRVLITGATGFVGQVLCEQLALCGYRLRAALRYDRPVPTCIAETAVVGDIGGATEWSRALEGVELVIHAAARTHVLRDVPHNEELFLATNANGTRGLARAAAQAGVRRFVYLSSIKVNGEETTQEPYRASDLPQPRDAYARSKLKGETHLAQAAASSGMQAVIVRPPLVYGCGVGANFLRLMRWIDRRWPLPFGALTNQRSLVSVWNLSDLIVTLLTHQKAAGGVWLVSDGEDLSTPELLRRMGRAMQRTVRLLPVTPRLLRVCGRLAGRGADTARLCGSLRVDMTATGDALHWSRPVSMDEALARTVAWYRSVYS